ncbi:hypothetical protein Salat_2425700 [Sesamum alatum]|uniref:Reverse transcriptase zinc-binding domain-containing protein n=1 Tax=Sesamum alatum TaxID=300844 RepID=A0AAE1XXW4_9LAMI|nr:hypothetical protein Salat_2425700 [Sesamum alatum]
MLPITAIFDILLVEGGGEWNEELVQEEFITLGMDTILSIPLGRSDNEDFLLWQYETSNCFTVRSAYHLATNIIASTCTSVTSSASPNCEANWSFLWIRKVPQKVHLFPWRTCHNALPTTTDMCHRGIPITAR